MVSVLKKALNGKPILKIGRIWDRDNQVIRIQALPVHILSVYLSVIVEGAWGVMIVNAFAFTSCQSVYISNLLRKSYFENNKDGKSYLEKVLKKINFSAVLATHAFANALNTLLASDQTTTIFLDTIGVLTSASFFWRWHGVVFFWSDWVLIATFFGASAGFPITIYLALPALAIKIGAIAVFAIAGYLSVLWSRLCGYGVDRSSIIWNVFLNVASSKNVIGCLLI
jgi:hypothetical protein